MTSSTATLLEQALALPAEARIALADKLWESIHGPADREAEREWEIEIARRLEEIDNGTAALIPLAEVLERVRRKHGRA